MRKASSFWCVCLFLFAAVLPSRCWGWINTGHKVVAFVAWEDLTPKTRAAISQILKQHPRYEKDLMAEAPAGEDPDRCAFAGAAVWPDVVKQQANPMRVQFSHSNWHYIDIPYDLDNQPLPPAPPESAGPHDVVTALKAELADLKNANASPVDRAVAACWIVHLVGDIHQPLHCAMEVSPEFPNGDQGGNLQFVLRDPPYTDSRENLHLLWDSLPGDFYSEDLDRYEAMGLRSDPKYSRESMKDQLAVTDFMAWANESHALAVKDAYLDGHLKSAVGHGRTAPYRDIPGVPPGYLDNAEHVAMHQVALAGYRLADLLNATFDPK